MSETAPLPLEKPKRDRRELSSDDVDTLLRKHFAPPHFAFITQVRNGTGWSRKTARTADAIAMGTWPSRGVHLHGIEVKVDHQDFKRELANPQKAEDIAQYCHFWWLAVTHEKVAPIEMVPENWGLLIVEESTEKLRVARAATKLTPIPPDYPLLASIMRKLSEEYVHVDSLKEWRNRTRAELEQAAQEGSRYLRESSVKLAKDKTELVARLEKALGCRISEWNIEGFAADFALAMKLRHEAGPILQAVRRLVTLGETMKPELEAVETAIAAIPKNP